MVDLVYKQGGEKFRIHLKQGATIIGRAMTCDVIITEKSVSSEHASIVLIGNSLSITDLDSSNGIIINGKKVARTTLKSGDKIKLGRVSIRIEGLKQDSADNPHFNAGSVKNIDPLSVYKTPADGTRPDPALFGMGRRKLRFQRERKQGLSPSLKFIFYLFILALTGLAAYLMISKDDSFDLKNMDLINPEYSSEAYDQDLLAGISECEKQNYSAAYTLWKEIDERWVEKNPKTLNEMAGKLALLIQPLAQAQLEESYLGIDWYTFEQKAKIFLIEAPEAPDEIIAFLKNLSQEAAKEDKTLGILKEATALYDKGEYLKAIKTAENPRKSRFYSHAAIELVEKSKTEHYERLANNVNLYADAGQWGKAIELATEILKESESPELEKNITKWRMLQGHQEIIGEAKKLIEKKTREDIMQAQRLLQEIPEDSRFYRQARGDILSTEQKILNLTVEEFWSEVNIEALNNLAKDNPTLKKDPRYLNIIKIANDTSKLLAQAEDLVKMGNFEAANETWADVCRIIPEKSHRYNQQASSRMAYYAEEKFGALYRNKALTALEKSDHKAARVFLDKAKQYGAEVEVDIKVLTDIARQLYTKSMNSANEELLLLEKARDCLIPSDPLYPKIQKRIIDLQGTLP